VRSTEFKPKWKYHATRDPKLVHTPEQELALGADWSDIYLYLEYPRYVFHPDKAPRLAELVIACNPK
jgi:hypothetical protein